MSDQGWLAGRYRNDSDAAGIVHGFVEICGSFVTFDIPGATQTSLNGINDVGFISGRYTRRLRCETRPVGAGGSRSACLPAGRDCAPRAG